MYTPERHFTCMHILVDSTRILHKIRKHSARNNHATTHGLLNFISTNSTYRQWLGNNIQRANSEQENIQKKNNLFRQQELELYQTNFHLSPVTLKIKYSVTQLIWMVSIFIRVSKLSGIDVTN